MTRPASLSAFTGSTLLRFETADGCTLNIDDEEAARRISFGDTKFRVMPGNITGDDVEAYLYRVLGLDRHRFVFDLPGSVRGTGRTMVGAGSAGSGTREGTVHLREHGKNSPPVGRVFFLTHDRRFREGDPEDRREFEALR